MSDLSRIALVLLLALGITAAPASDWGNANFSETAANNNATPPDGAPEGMAASTVNNTMREIMAATKRARNLLNPAYTTAGTNTITVTVTTAEAAYYTGQRYAVKLGGTNTGAATLNIGGLGAKDIKDIYGAALKGGELTSGQYAEFVYDGTNMVLLSTVKYLGPTVVWKQSLSGANVDFDPLPTGFGKCVLDVSSAIQATDNVDINLLVKVSSFQTSGYIGAFGTFDDGAGAAGAAQSTSAIKLATNAGNDTGEHLQATATIYDPDGTALHKKVQYTSAYTNSGGNDQSRSGWGAYAGGTGAVTGLRLIPASGNWTSGNAVLTCWRFS